MFTKETLILTNEGLKPIGELREETSFKILNAHGKWEEATVITHEKEKVYRLLLRRKGTKITKELFCSINTDLLIQPFLAEPRYERTNITAISRRAFIKKKEAYVFNKHYICPIGIMHGITFGKGGFDKEKGYATLNLKSIPKPYKEPFYHFYKSGRADKELITTLPSFFKDIPSIHSNPEYIKGFLFGLLETDGRKGSSVRIIQKNKEDVFLLRDLAETVGLSTDVVKEVTRSSNTFGEYDNCFEFLLFKESLRANGLIFNKDEEPESRRWIFLDTERTSREEILYSIKPKKSKSYNLDSGIHIPVYKEHVDTKNFHI